MVTSRGLIRTVLTLAAATMVILVLPAAATEIPDQLPDPDSAPPDLTRPVKVYILAGQSNMLHMGNISAGESGARIYRESDQPDARYAANVSLYKGKYSPEKDYDNMEPVVTELFNVLGGCRDAKSAEQLSTIDGDFTRIATGFLEVPQTGTYSFYPGNGTNSIMTVDGKQTYRKEPSQEEMSKTYIKLEGGKKYPFKAISLDGKISPHWRYHRKDTPGTLNMLVKEKGKFPYLLGKDGNWVERDDVFYQEARLNGAWNWDPNNPNKMLLDEAKLKASCKPLTVESNGIWVGVPFGFHLGDYYDEQVLLIRTAMGNRALAWDFRPPSSGKRPDIREDLKKWEGLEYRLMVEGVRKTLDNIATILPNYKGQGYEIAGFCWFQGHKDSGKQEWTDEYESNLVNLIKDVRGEFKVPKLPVVVATVGFGGKDMKDRFLQILEAQMAVSDPVKYPDFAGNVLTVDTRDFWRGKEVSPNQRQDYHYFRNAETYMLVGDALGRGMVNLIDKRNK